MKAYKIKKRDTSNINITVFVAAEEEMKQRIIPEGGCFDVVVSPLPKPHIKPKFVSKITPPTTDGRVEFVFRDR